MLSITKFKHFSLCIKKFSALFYKKLETRARKLKHSTHESVIFEDCSGVNSNVIFRKGLVENPGVCRTPGPFGDLPLLMSLLVDDYSQYLIVPWVGSGIIALISDTLGT